MCGFSIRGGWAKLPTTLPTTWLKATLRPICWWLRYGRPIRRRRRLPSPSRSSAARVSASGLLLITCLHDAYPGEQHPDEDPFGQGERPLPPEIPETLSRCLSAHYQRFDGLYDRAVPVDLTQAEDGFHIVDFGGERLKRGDSGDVARRLSTDLVADGSCAKAAGRPASQNVGANDSRTQRSGRFGRGCPFAVDRHSSCSGNAIAPAASAGGWGDQELDSKTLLKLSSVLGGRIALRMAARELLKFIPWVGMAVNAAAAFAFTYGSGKATSWYFREVKAGHLPTADQLREVYREQLQAGADLWRITRRDGDQ